MIVDCFTFYNELDLLNYRLNLLNDHIDYFVLVESNQTFAGNPKKLYYQDNIHLFENFKSKIIHVVVDLDYIFPNIDYSRNEQWINEKQQRNSIDIGIKRLPLCDSDLIIISDIDEIIDPTILGDISSSGTLEMDMYYYNLNTRHVDKWIRSKIVTFSEYSTTTPEQIRGIDYPLIKDAGWHLSYFGNAIFIQNKLKEFSHQELNTTNFTDLSIIQNKVNGSVDLFDRSYVPIQKINIELNNYLPPLWNIYLQNYYAQPKIDKLIYVYFHICCIGNWREIVDRMFFKLRNSSIYTYVKEIRCVVLGDKGDYSFGDDPKIKIILESPDILLYEKCTINQLYEDSLFEDFYVLYLHSKGVTLKSIELRKNVFDWVEYMCYFNVYSWSRCIKLLESHDAVGVNLQESCSDYPLHYSGNFWWSKSSHINKLYYIQDTLYNSPEFWITGIPGDYATLWNSNIHHYNNGYNTTNYQCF